MSRGSLAWRAFAYGAGFAVLSLLVVMLWTSWRRAALRAPMQADGEADARAVLEFATGRDPKALRADLHVRARLEELVRENGMVGAIVMDPDGQVLARAGELDPPVVSAALEGVSSKPAAREVGERMLYRQSNGALVAVVVEDRRAVEEAWRPVRNRGLVAAIVTVGLSPLVGWLLARVRRRPAD